MVRYFRPLGLLLLTAFFVLPLPAQVEHPEGPTDIKVYVTFDNDRPAGEHLRVDLSNTSGIPISQAFTDTGGRTMLQVPSHGEYIVKVSGEGIQDGSSERFQVNFCPSHCGNVIYLRVKHKAGLEESTAKPSTAKPSTAKAGTATESVAQPPNPAITSAAELRIPPDARKSFDQGMTAWQNRNYQQAAEKFEKAVAEYPQYDTAYNNLGVMYAHLGQNDKSMAAFKHAVELNDKNADADRNLARLLIREKDYPDAEGLLKKALAVQAPDATTLTLLAITEIQDGKPDDALKDAQKVHGLPHEGYAVVHYIAGGVLEEKHQYTEAEAEYNLYLKEAPNGTEAAEVKTALQRLASPTASAAPQPQ